MRVIIIAILTCLAACSVEQVTRQPYAAAEPVTQLVAATTYGPGELEVRLLEGRAWVEPTNRWHREHFTEGARDRWIATASDQRAVYEAALMKSLAGQTCKVTAATPQPLFFAFEFTFSCS